MTAEAERRDVPETKFGLLLDITTYTIGLMLQTAISQLLLLFKVQLRQG